MWNLHTYTFPYFYRRPFAYIPVPVWDPVRPILTRSSRERVLESNGLEFLPGKPAKDPRTHGWFTSETWTSKSSSIYIFKILHRNILRFTNETTSKNDNVHIVLNKNTVAQKGIWTPNILIKCICSISHIFYFKKAKYFSKMCVFYMIKQ